MAFRLDKSVVRGEIDNRQPGQVCGRIWFSGRDEPIVLKLAGNCLRDIAGCRIEFENPAPEAGQPIEHLNAQQEGLVGDITASRKVRVLEMPVGEAYALRKAGQEVPYHMGNCLYVEWFSENNGRVVIETTGFRIRVSEPAWRMSGDEERSQSKENTQAMKDYMAHLNSPDEIWEDEEEDMAPMNEFEWERKLRESDALADRYGAVMEKYLDHPDRDKLIAREMGWTWLEDALDADDRGVFDEARCEPDDLEPLEPNPLTEKIDWIRTDDGDIKHPLSEFAFETVMTLWHECHAAGMIEEDGDAALTDMLIQAQTLSAKLAGALDGLAYDDDPEGGFIVACLKRALKYFEASFDASNKVREAGTLDDARLQQFRADLFRIRSEVLDLMTRFRSAI